MLVDPFGPPLPARSAFLTASYDSCIRLFSYASPQEPMLTYKVPSTSSSAAQGLVAARWVKDGQVATAGMDGAVRLFSVPSTADATPRQLWWGTHHPISVKGKAVTAPKASMGMGPSALTSLDVAADGSGLVTASRDGSVAYWRLDELRDVAAGAEQDAEDGDDEEEGSRKRRKAANGKNASSTPSQGKRPTAFFWHSLPTTIAATSTSATPSHAPHPLSRVSSVIFHPSDPVHRCLTAGYDGKLMEWDLFSATRGGNPKVSVRGTSDSRAILCLAGMLGEEGKVVSGQMDRSLAIWDVSDSASSSSSTVVIPNAHAGPIYDVSAHPTDSHLFASAGGEGMVKVWDTRSHKRALFTLQKPASATDAKGRVGGKLLACEWDRSKGEDGSGQSGQVVLAGGEDCAVNVFRGQGIGA